LTQSKFFVGIGLAAICFGCGDKNTPPNPVAPTNLSVTAVVATDNSGQVQFTATANNATLYEFDLGNGIFQNSTSGSLTYRYPVSGNYTVNVVAKGATGLTTSKSINVSVTVVQSMVWSDEFDQPGAPNPQKWIYDIGAGGWGNNESQYYTNRLDNAIVSNGTLKIIAKAETYSGSSYTSARLLSRTKFTFKYGKIEVFAKVPVGAGTWPAIWMLGDNFTTVGWPACGEIDIMEHKGSDPNRIHGSVHYPGFSGGNAVTATTLIQGAATSFHLYACEWSPQSIKFFVDGNLFHTVANTSSLPFNQSFFILLNQAMGGIFGGAIDPAFSNATFEIDYVRVYQ
jgi:beta-glucanase (GH16 family)